MALVGAGVFALVKIGGDDDKGGAASPTEAGQDLVKALNDEDILGAVDLLLPGERETFRQPMIDLVDNLKRLEVLGDKADPSKVAGVDIDLSDPEGHGGQAGRRRHHQHPHHRHEPLDRRRSGASARRHPGERGVRREAAERDERVERHI